MPNLKVYVDQRIFDEKSAALSLCQEGLRDCVVSHLGVSREACQLAVLPVLGPADQVAINAEIQMFSRPDRRPEIIEAFSEEVGQILARATGERCAFRCLQLDAPACFVLR